MTVATITGKWDLRRGCGVYHMPVGFRVTVDSEMVFFFNTKLSSF
jgi:hypothetical protein